MVKALFPFENRFQLHNLQRRTCKEELTYDKNVFYYIIVLNTSIVFIFLIFGLYKITVNL